jgi:hypothetical protein
MTDPLFIVHRRSHHFLIKDIKHPSVTRMCLELAMKYVQYKQVPQYGQMVRVADKVYAASNPQRQWFSFHINQWADFERALEKAWIKRECYGIVDTPYYTPDEVTWEFKTDKVPRDYQKDILSNYLLHDEPRNKLISFQTGKGKGLTLQLAIKALKARLLLVVKPMYCEKWKKEMHDVFDVPDKEVVVVRGSAMLQSLIDKAVLGQAPPAAIILSLPTYQLWIKAYEESAELAKMTGYNCTPDELNEILGIGVRAVDEVHMHFHQVFKTDLYTHVPKSICMSATLFNKDPFVKRMYETMFPVTQRYTELELSRYIDVTAVMYSFHKPELMRTVAYGSTFFNSGVLEQSIQDRVQTRDRWLELIKHIVDIGYMKVTRPKKRVAIYVYLQTTIALVVSYLQRYYPDLKVSSYMGGDPLSNILEADICVTTVGSAGTALDIPDLTNVILARDIGSMQANVQLVGRLRALPDGHPVQMHYLFAGNLDAPSKYHEDKKELFRDRVKSQTLYIWAHPL